MTTGEAVWCHDCGTHEKCQTQQRAEAELEQARAEIDRLRAMMGDSE